MGIQAIETRYKGYRFRSRLEARWAVFLDRLGVIWEYEPEGYLVNGEGYLPDFFIPEWNAFIEVKPNIEAVAADNVRLIAFSNMVRTDTGGKVIFAVGIPAHGDEEYFSRCVYYFEDFTDSEFVCGRFCPGRFLEDRKQDGVYWMEDATTGSAWMLDKGRERENYKWPIVSARIKDAVDAARSARFEFGEKG